MFFNENYIGKTKELQEIEKQLSIVRRKRMGTYILDNKINLDKDMLKLNRMIEQYFGFGTFSLNIIGVPVENAFTCPIDMRYDVFNTKKDLVANTNLYKFKKEADYTAMVYVYSGIFFNPLYTDEEVFAVILHEIGHNFFSAINDKNGVLIKLFKVLQICKAIFSIIPTTSPDDDDASDITLPAIISLSSNLLDNTEIVKKIEKKIDDYIHDNLPFIDSIINLLTYLKNIGTTVAGGAIKTIDYLTLGTLTASGAVFGISEKLKSKLLPISAILGFISYRNEKTADNFVTMYGYGGALSSFCSKVGSVKKSPSEITKTLNKVPVLPYIYAINKDIPMLLFELFDEHPNSLVRINDQIRLLEYELNNNTIDPKMKKAIQNDILACKKEIEFITNMSPENKHIVRIAYHKILKKYFNSRDIKDYLFDDKSKFSAY